MVRRQCGCSADPLPWLRFCIPEEKFAWAAWGRDPAAAFGTGLAMAGIGRRTMGFFRAMSVVAAAATILGATATARAQGAGGSDSDFQLRLYIMALTGGSIDKTPADASGNFKTKNFENNGATLEMILYRHIGLSVSQEYEDRRFTNTSGQATAEDWVDTYYSLTAYLLATGHHKGNLFAGYSSGTVDRYTEKLNGTPMSPYDPARNLPLTRVFAGVEYTAE